MQGVQHHDACIKEDIRIEYSSRSNALVRSVNIIWDYH